MMFVFKGPRCSLISQHRVGPLWVSAPRRTRAMSTRTSSTPNMLYSLQGSPTVRLVSPGICQFTPDFQPVTLVDRQAISSTSSILRFALPNPNQPLQLPTCACVLAGAMIHGKQVVRPYTPISTNDLVGHVDFLIKNYGDQGTMSQFLHQVEVGSTDIAFQHIAPNVKIQAPFPQEHIVMLAGGTGITPMLQALHAILGNTEKPNQKVTLLYGSQTSQDILGQSLLDEWARDYSDRLKVVHVLSEEPSLSSWAGRRGFIDLALLAEHLSSSSHDVMVLVCGPPAMYKALCGPRQESDRVSGILGQMGFASDKVYKF